MDGAPTKIDESALKTAKRQSIISKAERLAPPRKNWVTGIGLRTRDQQAASMFAMVPSSLHAHPTVLQAVAWAQDIDARGVLRGIGRFILVLVIVLIIVGIIIGVLIARMFNRRR